MEVCISEGNPGAATKGPATTICPKVLPYAGVSNDLNSIPRGEYKNIFKEHEPFLSTKLEYDSAKGRYTSKVWKEVERNPGESISSYVNRRDASAIEGLEVLYAKKRREISDETMDKLASRLEKGAYFSKEEMQAIPYGKPSIKARETEKLSEPISGDMGTTSLKQASPAVKRIEDAGLTLKKHGDLSPLYDAAQDIRTAGMEGFCKHAFPDMRIHPIEEITPALENADYKKLIDFYTSVDYDAFKHLNPEDVATGIDDGKHLIEYLLGKYPPSVGEPKVNPKKYSAWWSDSDRKNQWKKLAKQNSWWDSRNSGYGWKDYFKDSAEKAKKADVVREKKQDESSIVPEYKRATGGLSIANDRLSSYKGILDYVRGRNYGPGKSAQRNLTYTQFREIMNSAPNELEQAFMGQAALRKKFGV